MLKITAFGNTQNVGGNLETMRNILTSLLIFCSSIVYAQNNTLCFENYSQYKTGNPSVGTEFTLVKRTSGDQILMGGISNYTFKDVYPKELKNKLTKEYFAVSHDGKVYINQFPFTKFKYYNELIGIGRVSYFVGLPPGPMDKQNQINLGFIKAGQGPIYITHSVGYVLLHDGTIKYLGPKLLSELVIGHKDLEAEVAINKYSSKDYIEMFKVIDKLNEIEN